MNETPSKNILEVKNLNFTYPTADHRVLEDINLQIQRGEFVLICGSSGSGKTTLAKCLNGIIPHLADGEMEGDVIVNGMNTQHHYIHELSSEIGMVFQNPEDQIFSIRVVDEVAFGVECQGYPKAELVKRVDFALEKLRITDIKNKLTFALSGGQKQKVSIASNLASSPSVLILDDPTTDLDPISTQGVMDILVELKNEVDITFLVIEHDLTDLLEHADRVIVLHEGRIFCDGLPKEVFYNRYDELDAIGIRIPDHIRLGKYLMDQGFHFQDGKSPVKKDDIFNFAKDLLESKAFEFPAITYRDYTRNGNQVIAKVDHVDFQYPGATQPTLFDIDLDIYQGEFIAIVGHNGSGKSTLMKNLLGLLQPTKGQLTINSHDTAKTKIEELILDIGYVFQNPDNQLFCNSVREEVEFGLKNRDFTKEKIKKETDRVLELVDLMDRQEAHPFSLSRGQRQRLAVATMLALNPKIIMLDEPTTGQDDQNLKGLLQLMSRLVERHGATIIMVTHDMEMVAKSATRVIIVNDGRIVLDGTPVEIFHQHYEELEDLNLKPPIISSMSAALNQYGMPYIPDWSFFQKEIN